MTTTWSMFRTTSFIIYFLFLLSQKHHHYGSCYDVEADDDNDDSPPSPPINTFNVARGRSNNIEASESLESGADVSPMHPTRLSNNNKLARHKTRNRYPLYTSTATNDSEAQSYCIQRPVSLNFCGSTLDYGDYMRLPNLIGHKNENELSEIYSLMQNLSKVQCEAMSQLKLVLCSLLSPVCLDTYILPCRQSCLLAKSSCRQSMDQKGLRWPSFLDCRRLPASHGNCVGRTLAVVFTNNSTNFDTITENINLRNRTTATNKRRRKMKKVRPSNRTVTTAATATTTTTTTTSAPAASKADSGGDYSLHNILTTPPEIITSSPTLGSTTPAINNDISVTNTATVQAYNNYPTTSGAQDDSLTHESFTTVSSTDSLSTVAPKVSVTESSSPIATIALTLPSTTRTTTTTTTPNVNPMNHHEDYSSMPINITNDLTQLICSTSPEWLIKTKLTDNQLQSATQTRDLRVRVYRQVFGSFSSYDIKNNSRPYESQSNKLPVPILARNNDTVRGRTNITNLNLTLSNTTMFITAIGPTLYNQPLSNALVSKDRGSSNQADQSHSHKTGRYYLISGTGQGPNSPKLANVFIIWPNIHRGIASDLDSRANRQILKTYRKFKISGLKVCDRLRSAPMTRRRSIARASPSRARHQH